MICMIRWCSSRANPPGFGQSQRFAGRPAGHGHRSGEHRAGTEAMVAGSGGKWEATGLLVPQTGCRWGGRCRLHPPLKVGED